MSKVIKSKRLLSLLTALFMMLTIIMPAASSKALAAETQSTVNLQILATSDLHGRFMPYAYATDTENTNGSYAQIATIVKEARTANPNTIVVDNGDTIQDNFSNLFLNDTIHPMILAMNEIGYDSWTLGNHEFNYGVPALEKIMAESKAKVLGGNVYKPNGERLAAPYTIVEKGGVKVGIIGMTNPNITKWDAANLEGYKVTSPVVEAKKAAAELKGKVDVLIAVIHVGPTPEYNNDDGADLIANAIPELDAIVAGHLHSKIVGNVVNGVLITEPNSAGVNVSKIDIKLTKNSSGKYVVVNKANDITSSIIDVKNYASDPDLSAKLKPQHDRAIADARTVIGKLEDGDLVEPNEVNGIPTCQIQDTAMIDLINEVQMHYTGAEVGSAAAFSSTANIKKGDIKKAGVSAIYMYDNTLYKLQVTGSQLKKYMEWSAKYYNTFKDGDLTISFDPNIRAYNYDMFSGVTYQVDISKEPGNRIVNLRKNDGTLVKDEDVLTLAVNNYRANSQLLNPAAGIYTAEDMPKLLEKDVKQGTAVRDLITEYIQTVKNGVIKPNYDNNWKLTGYSWDSAKRAKTVAAINAGKLSLPLSADGRTPNVRSIVWSDVPVKEVDIVSFNDFHGSLKQDGKNVGAAILAGEIKKMRQENPETIVVSGGDIYQGSAMSNLTYGKPVSEMLKSIGITASAVGNHEFDWGTDKIEGWAKDGNFDFLASNVYDKTTGQPVSWAIPYKVVNFGGVNIGFIGLATPETAFKVKADIVKNIEFKDPIESAEYWSNYLKTNNMADYVIALTHLGAAQDAKTKEITGEAADLAKKVKLDGIIAAHTHNAVSGTVNNVPIVEAYYNGRTLAKLAMLFNEDGKFLGIKPSYDNLYSRTNLVEDAAVKAIYDKYNEELKPILDEVIGKTEVALGHDKNAGVSLLGEWSSDVMRKAAGTQIAIQNGGGLRVPVPAGDITMGKLYEVMPFDNTLVKMELKGSDLKKAIENGIMNTSIGWVQLSGVKVYYDAKAVAGSRITSMRLPDGTKIENDKYYSVVTNDFMQTGGDGYDFKGGIKVVDTGIPIRDALVNEIKSVTAAGKTLNPVYVEALVAGADPVKSTVDTVKPVSTDTVKPAPAVSGKVISITARVGLNVRQSSSTTAKVIGLYKYGTKVTVEEDLGLWYRVKYNNKDAYIYKQYTK